MFRVDKKELMESIKIIKGDVCAYGQKEVGEMCDCKYRQKETSHSPLSESFSGCCELSLTYLILSKMTDKEYEELCERKH